MPPALLYPLLSVLPVGFVALVVKAWRWWEEARSLRVPVMEKLLRAPGQLIRKRKESLDNQITDMLIWVLGLPYVLAVCYFAGSRRSTAAPPSIIWAFILVVAVIFYITRVTKLISLLEEREVKRQEFAGEKAIGEELNRFMCEGCQVFHDLSFDHKGRIDHIVVAPSGVYAVETSVRRKGDPSGRQKPHEVIYDGKGLQFPGFYDKEHVIQARNQARSLSDFLSRSVGSSVAVKPVLALPGWNVVVKSPGDVLVLNSKGLRGTILGEAEPSLLAYEIKQIAQHLDAKCRDTEF